jgi:hypothetical protein
MKKFYILAALFFALAVYANAQDTIVLQNGNIIEAKVEEISAAEIKYRRFDNLSGPLVVINKSEVLSIRYENGTVEVINSSGQQAAKPAAPALDPNKFYFSFSLEPSGFIAGGPSATAEFSKGAFISSVHASFPSLALNSAASGFGFGAGGSFNFYWGGPIGGFFLGGAFEWNMFPYSYTVYNPYKSYNYLTDTFTGENITEKTNAHTFILALNGGYKFVLKNGIYFRTGAAAGVSFSPFFPVGFYYKPDIATGYIF